MRKASDLQLHVLIKKEKAGDKDMWVAQALEFDVVAQAPTKSQLQEKFSQTIVAYMLSSIQNGEEPLAGLKRLGEAPEDLWKNYVKGKGEKTIDLLPRTRGPRFNTSKIGHPKALLKQVS